MDKSKKKISKKRKIIGWILLILCICALFYQKDLWYILYMKNKPFSRPRHDLKNNEVLFWIVGDSEKVLPADKEQKTNVFWNSEKKEVNLHGANGETIAFQIVLATGSKDITLEDIKADDIRNNSQIISKNNITFYKELYVDVQGKGGFGTTGKGEYPDALIPFYDPYSQKDKKVAIPFKVEQNINHPIWVDIKIPRNNYSGVFKSNITLQFTGTKNINISVICKIWNFELPDEKHLAAFSDLYGARFYKGEKVPWKLSDETWEILKHYEVMAHNHGFVNGHWGLEPVKTFDNNGKLVNIDWSNYDKYLGQVLSGSLFNTNTKPICWEVPIEESWCINLSPKNELKIEEYAREIEKHFIEKEWLSDQTFVYVFDEPYSNANDSISRWGKALDKGSTKLKHLVTIHPKEELENIDIWAPFACEYYPPLQKKEKEKGKLGWFYQTETEPFLPVESVDTYGLAFRIWPWIARKYVVDGIFFWASNFWKDNPYKDLDDYYGDGEGLLFYPGAKLDLIGLPIIKGPVSSFRMKAWRRGLQDYEYLYLLEQNGLKDKADEIVNILVESALAIEIDDEKPYQYRGYWNGQRGPAMFPSRYEDRRNLGEWNKTPEDYYNARRKMAEILDKAISGK